VAYARNLDPRSSCAALQGFFGGRVDDPDVLHLIITLLADGHAAGRTAMFRR